MSSVHTIRLRDPWDVQTLPDGRTEYRRKFGKPRTTDPTETVWLQCTGFPEDAVFVWNGEPLPSAECVVTSRFLPRNELRIMVPKGSSFGSVALEIRTSA